MRYFIKHTDNGEIYAVDAEGNVIVWPSTDHSYVISTLLEKIPPSYSLSVRGATIIFESGVYNIGETVFIEPIDGEPFNLTLVGESFNTTQLRVDGDYPAIEIRNNVFPTTILNLGFWVNEGVEYYSHLLSSYNSGPLFVAFSHFGRGSGIYLEGGEGSTIENNWFEKVPNAISLKSRADYNTTSIVIKNNNIVLAEGGAGLYAEWNEDANRFLYYLLVEGNRFSSLGGGDGIIIRTVQRSAIIGNLFWGLSSGIVEKQYSDYNLITNNLLYAVSEPLTVIGSNTISEPNAIF